MLYLCNHTRRICTVSGLKIYSLDKAFQSFSDRLSLDSNVALTSHCQRAFTPAVLTPQSRLSQDLVNESEMASQVTWTWTTADRKGTSPDWETLCWSFLTLYKILKEWT